MDKEVKSQQTPQQAAWEYREKFVPRKIVDAHLSDAFLAGVKWARQNPEQQPKDLLNSL